MEEQVAPAVEQTQAVQPEQAETQTEAPKETKIEDKAEQSSANVAAQQKPEQKKKKVKKEISEVKSTEKISETQITENKILTEADKLAKAKKAEEEKRRQKFAHLKLFNRWSTDFEIRDLGLRPYLNISPMVVPYSAGRNIKKQFWKSKKSIVERLILKLMATGHKGKKHYWTTRSQTGMLATQYNAIKRTLERIEEKTKKNPVEVLVRAFEVGSPREGVATIEYGGVRYPKAADMSPQRRIDLCLRWMTQGAFNASRKNKRHVWDALADEIIAASNNDATKSNCLTKRTDLERQAGGSR